MTRYSGVAPPLATPFQDGEVAWAWFRENLESYCRTSLSGFLVLGSNGEAVHLSREERLRLVEIAREVVPEDRWLLAGTGEASTKQALDLTREAGQRGADAALVAPPFYYKRAMTREALYAHYVELAENSPIPILLYNVPQFTGLNLEPDLVGSLAEHPNVAGIKDSSGNIGQLTEIRRLTPADFDVLVGSAPVFFPALCIGANGGILAAANVLPDPFVRLYRLVQEGDLEAARALQWSLMEISRAVTSEYGIGGLKAAMDLMGLRGGEARRPLAAPGQAARARLERLLAPWRRQ